MKRLLMLTFLLGLSLLLGSISTFAQPIIIDPPMPPGGGIITDGDSLSVDFLRVNTTIDNQVAQTQLDLQFTNHASILAEGTFIFPLPQNAAVDNLTLIIDGISYDAKILSADEARGIYNEIVRQYRDPALLEYVGTQAIQANVFPIPPNESRRVQIGYTQLLESDNDLVQYTFPIDAKRLVKTMSIRVDVTDSNTIGTIYSPSHTVAINRSGDNGFTASYEASNIYPTDDFTLYYGQSREAVDLSLLTYRESANEDGFFLLLVQPPAEVPAENVVPKDMVIVLDQSGSMDGTKWQQAVEAVRYVLDNLNPQDRFNVVVFSSGYRLYANEMQPAANADEAKAWISNLFPEGGTNINEALLQALDMVGERSTNILFLTDGEATEGEVETPAIIENLHNADKANARIFTFGVGDSVNTILLDTIVRDFRGTGTYVRESQRIDEAVASLFNKINAPALTDVALDFGGANVELLYPQSLSDLFAGEQITLVGRYRGGADNVTVTLTGIMNNEERAYTVENVDFSENANGQAFIARLWATRRIGDLLNSIRLNGESEELVDSIVNLSLRYGIITPYTSFLIEEDDILTQDGRRRAMEEAEADFSGMNDMTTGSAAVDTAQDMDAMMRSEAPAPSIRMNQPTQEMMYGDGEDEAAEVGAVGRGANALQTVGDKTFVQLDGVWTDTTFTPESMETQKVTFLSDEYFTLLDEYPELAEYFALGEQVIVVVDGVAYEVVME